MPINQRRASVPGYVPPGLASRPGVPRAEPPPRPLEGPESRPEPKEVRSVHRTPERPSRAKPDALMDAKTLGGRIAVAMKAAGVNQTRAAERLGIPRQRVSEWCNGRHEPGACRLVWLVETLGLDWSLICGG